MALTIATNVASLNTQKWMGISQTGLNAALEKLSSGYKINKAADDAAGVAIALKLDVKAQAVSKAIDNGNQGIAMIQTAESGVEQIANILNRLKQLATQAASDNMDGTSRANLDNERQKLETEIDKIANGTVYGSQALLNGGTGASTISNVTGLTPTLGISNIDASGAAADTYTVDVDLNTAGTIATLTVTNTAGDHQSVALDVPAAGSFGTSTANFSDFGVSIGINENMTAAIAGGSFDVSAGGVANTLTFQSGDTNSTDNQITLALSDYTKAGLSITGDLTSKGNAQAYMDAIDAAVDTVDTNRATLGATQNMLSYQVANLQSTYQNAQSAESTIKDADYAKEMANYTKFNVMNQAGVAMLAQSNQLPQQILTLLRG